MRSLIIRTIGLAGATLVLATSAQAQGRGEGKSKQKSVQVRRDDGRIIRDANGDIIRIDDRRRVPPGLAKKPGQMPPGQYKKRYRDYRTYDGASVLSEIMRNRGYDVLRVVPYGSSHSVYYRLNNHDERRAIVRLGEDRLRVSNVPTAIVQAVLAHLY